MNSAPGTSSLSPWKEIMSGTVIVSALGYFVDIYDLILFSIVRVKSLTELRLTGDDLLEKGVLLLNSQMLGMLLGGVIWGVLGDKLGRVKVLFGSILLYSVANLLNAMVTNVDQYALLRFIAGIGLAGELGAAITLVSESLSIKGRGHGATMVAAIGVSGAVFAGLVANFLSWRMAYGIGGVLGLSLLILRMKTFESKMFEESVKSAQAPMGQFFSLFVKRERFMRYLRSILIGVPLWFGVGILVTFSPEIAVQLGITGPVSAGSAVMAMYGGLAIGDLASGILSQKLRSRKKAATFFMVMALICSLLLSTAHGASPGLLYAIIFAMGIGMGYWAVFMMIAAEQFGTNLRATVTTTVPNFVRGSVVLLTLGFTSLKPLLGTLAAAQIMGVISFSLSFWAIWSIRETYGDDLDFLET